MVCTLLLIPSKLSKHLMLSTVLSSIESTIEYDIRARRCQRSCDGLIPYFIPYSGRSIVFHVFRPYLRCEIRRIYLAPYLRCVVTVAGKQLKTVKYGVKYAVVLPYCYTVGTWGYINSITITSIAPPWGLCKPGDFVSLGTL